MITAVAAPTKDPRPLYVLQLEELVRRLDRIIDEEGPNITREHPSDHGLEQWMADIVVDLRPPGWVHGETR